MKKDVAWGLFDQALQSLVNLAIGATLIHFATKEEYGLYGLGFAAQLLLTGISNALVSTPMTVIVPSKDKLIQDDFSFGLIIGFFKILLPIVFLFVLSVFLIDQWHPISNYTGLAYTLALSSPWVILIEIMRRYLYIKQDSKSVFLMDTLYTCIYIASLTILLNLTRNNLHIFALSLSGIAGFIASIVFLLRSNMNFSNAKNIASSSLKEAWKDGSWSLGGVLISWGQNQGYVYVLALMKSSAIVAEANAARLFLAPISVISLGFSKVLMPRIVRLKVDGKIDEALKLARHILLIMIGIIITYGFFIASIKTWIIDTFIQKDYIYLDVLITSWTIYFLCQSFRNNNSILMQAFRYFKEITISSAWTSLSVLILITFVAKYFSINYVILTMSLGELVLAAILWKRFNQKQQSLNNKDALIENSPRSKYQSVISPINQRFSKLFYICAFVVLIQLISFVCLINWGGVFFSTPNNAPEKSDLIVVLGGGTGDRLEKSLELYNAGYAPKLLLTGLPEMHQQVLPTYSTWRKKYLLEQNVPETSILIDNSARNSLEEARAVKELMQKHNWHKVIIVSDPPHLRRLSMIYSNIFTPKNDSIVYLVKSNPTWWNAKQWWRNPVATQFVLLEILKTFNFQFGSFNKYLMFQPLDEQNQGVYSDDKNR